LTARGVEFESVNYIEKPFSASELRDLLQRAGLKPQDVLRRNEPAYKQLVAGKELSDHEVLKLMAAHPELVQRPIVVRDDKVVLARPIENLSKLGIK
jgi:arsenate reductase (glutaredoxin)